MQEPSAAPQAQRRSAVILWLWAAFLGVVVLAVFQHLFLDSTLHWDFNAIRLERSFALRAGVPLYPGPDSGVVLNTIYGPLGALAYLPATLASRPAAAILIGQGIAWLAFFLPVIVLHGWATRGGQKVWAVFGLLAFAALTADMQPLAYVAFSVHVDAPTLALVALACFSLLAFRHRPGWAHFITSALFTVLALWSKQVALPLVVVLPAWVWLTEGWRRAVRFLICLAICGTFVSAAILWFFGPVENVLFNLWTVPRNQVMHESGRIWDLVGAFRRHIQETALLGVLVVVTAALEVRRHALQGASGGRLRAVPGMLFALVGLSLLPGALVAFRKPGGDVNAMSYDSYFLLAAVTLTLTGLAQSSAAPRRLVSAARGLLVTLPGLVLLTVVLWQEPGCLSSWRRPVRLAELPAERAYEYARRHPGEVYFPRLTLATTLAEGRIDHQSVGLVDRKVAGLPLSPDHLRAHLPPRLRAVAMVENGFIGERAHLGLPEYSQPVDEPELPGFVVFEQREAPVDEPALPARSRL